MAEQNSEQSADAGDAKAPAEGSAQAGGTQDYLERVRTDADFAEREVRRLQSEHDKVASKHQKLEQRLGKASKLVEQYGGDAIATVVEEWGEMKRSGSGRGKPDTSASKPKDEGDSDDRWLTDTERALKREIDAQNKLISELNGRLNRQESSVGVTRVQDNLERAGRELGLTPDIFSRVSEETAKDIEAWGRQAEAGDGSGISMLQSFSGPKGLDNVKKFLKTKLEDSDWESIIEHRRNSRTERLESLSTGGPSAARGSARSLVPGSFKSAAEAARAARLNPDAHDSF
jgi:hypothetical protein